MSVLGFSVAQREGEWRKDGYGKRKKSEVTLNPQTKRQRATEGRLIGFYRKAHKILPPQIVGLAELPLILRQALTRPKIQMVRESKIKELIPDKVVVALEAALGEMGFRYVKAKGHFLRQENGFHRLIYVGRQRDALLYD